MMTVTEKLKDHQSYYNKTMQSGHFTQNHKSPSQGGTRGKDIQLHPLGEMNVSKRFPSFSNCRPAGRSAVFECALKMNDG